MGELIDLQKFRKEVERPATNGLIMETRPPLILFKYYENGMLVEQHQVISEHLLREMLDGLHSHPG